MVLEKAETGQGQSPNIRTVAVKGLAGYKIDTITKFNQLQNHAPKIMHTIMNTIGDDFFESDLNYHALMTLKAMLKVIPNNVVLSWPTEIVSKIIPFFNLCEKRDAAAAIAVFGQLSIFMTNLISDQSINETTVQENKELFIGLIQQVIVQLLLHLNNEDHGEIKQEIRQSSKMTLVQVFKFYGNPNYDKICETHLETTKKLNYSEFLKDFAKIPDEMLHTYIEKAMYYFLLGDARLRANAVHLVTHLVVENATQIDNGEKVCQELAKLLCDSNSEVKIAAAANLGKVCLAVTKM